MKKHVIGLGLLLFAFSCNNEITTTASNSSLRGDIKNISYNLKGRMINPSLNFNLKKFKTKATLAWQNSISVINSSNQVVYTGTTDDAGNFIINISTVPSTTEVYVLEGFRNYDGKRVSLRTFIKFDGTRWHSIKQGEVMIDLVSTAICVISGYNPTVLNPANAIDSINLSGGYVSSITSLTTPINQVTSLVESLIIRGKDPVSEIVVKDLATNKYIIEQSSNYDSLTKENNCSGCDLRDTDLSKVDLAGKDLSYADLRGQNLSTRNLSETILIGADLRGATLPDDLSYLNLSEVKLTGSDLRTSSGIKNLKGTDLSYADLTAIDLHGTSTTLSDLTKARLTGVDFKDGNLQYVDLKKVHLFEAKFSGVDIQNSDFTESDLTAVDMSNKNVTNVNLADANLTGANFSGVNMTQLKSNPSVAANKLGNALVSGINLEGSTLSGIDLSNKNFFQANLKDAVFTGIGSSDGKLLKANFRNANLSGAYLNNLDLSDLNFTNCDLSDARLTGSRAIGTDFTGANLQGAYLNVGVNFIRTKFISADMRGLKGFKSSTDVDFSYADMSGFNLSNMGMSSIIFGKSTSGTGCLFHKTNLTGANTSGSGTSFASSQLDGAIMTNGNFSSNNFQSSSLVKNSDIANFSGSNFNSANFSGVGTISFVIVNSSTNYGNTIWHNGFKCSSTSNQGLCKDSNDNTIP